MLYLGLFVRSLSPFALDPQISPPLFHLRAQRNDLPAFGPPSTLLYSCAVYMYIISLAWPRPRKENHGISLSLCLHTFQHLKPLLESLQPYASLRSESPPSACSHFSGNPTSSLNLTSSHVLKFFRSVALVIFFFFYPSGYADYLSTLQCETKIFCLRNLQSLTCSVLAYSSELRLVFVLFV